MRTSIVLWSAASGAIIGLFIDAGLVGGAVLAGALLPQLRLADRVHGRWIVAAVLVALIAIPACLTVLGYLEGQLKAA